MKTSSTFALGLALLSLTSCMPSGTPTSLDFKVGDMTGGKVVNRAQSLAAFRETVYPIARANCLNCHNSETRSQSPVFADADPDRAFDAITSSLKINLAAPASSRVVMKLKNESHNCWSGSCQDDSDEMLAAVQRWAALAPPDGSAGGIVTDAQLMPLEATARPAQTEHGTLLLQAEQDAYRLDVVAGRYFDLQDSLALDGKYLSSTAIGGNPHTVAPRTLAIDAAKFNSCREFEAADLAPASRAIRIMAPRVHIPSGTIGAGGKIANDGYRPFSSGVSIQVIRPDRRLEYARMIYSGDYSSVLSATLFNSAPSATVKVPGTKLPDSFQGAPVTVSTSAAVFPHFTDWEEIFNSDGSYKSSGTFTRDDGTTGDLHVLFKDGSYGPTGDRLQRNFVRKPILKRDNLYRFYKEAMANLFFSDSVTRKNPYTYPYSQFVNADVSTYFAPFVAVELQCPATLDCVANPNLLKWHVVSESGTVLTQANALDCYTLDGTQTNLVPAAASNCDGSDRRFFHYIDLFVRPVISDPAILTAHTVNYYESSTPGSFVNWETFAENTSRRKTYNSNQAPQELDPDVLFTGGASVVTPADDLANFSATLYPALQGTRCLDCHGNPSQTMAPQFVSSNPGTALSVLKSGGYINMNVPTASFRNPGMIHNCNGASSDPRYSCASADEEALKARLVTAITNWKAANEADAEASGAELSRSLSNDERLPGRTKYRFRVTEAGTYNVWVKVKNIQGNTRLNYRILNASGSSMSYSVGSNSAAVGTCHNWTVNTAADFWAWSTPGRDAELPALDQRGYLLLDNNKNPLPLPNNRVYFTLPVGEYTLDLIGLTEGLRLDAVGINRVENFSADERLMFQPDRRAIDEKSVSDYRRKVLRYDLSQKLGLKNGRQAFFEIEVKKQFGNQNFVFRNPRFLTIPRDFNLKFKGIKVFINGKWSFPDATYNALEGISGDDRVLTYAPLIALTMGAADQIHFQFDQLQVTSEGLTPLYPKGSLPSPVVDRRCAEVDYFMRNVKPILFETKLVLTQDLRDFIGSYPGGARNFPGGPRIYRCIDCHTSTHPFFKMSTFTNNEEFCREALSRVDFQNFYQSLVIRGINGTGNHPKFVFVEKFVNQPDNNFKLHDQGQDYMLGRYRNQSGIASELVPGPLMIWNKSDLGISASNYTDLNATQKAMIQRNGLFRSLQNRKISTAVESYSWYQPDLHHSLIYRDNGGEQVLDNVLTTRDVIDPDPLLGRLDPNRNNGGFRVYDILGIDGSGIPYNQGSVATESVPLKGLTNKQYVASGPLGFDRATIDYISTTPGNESEAQMWENYELQRDFYREKVVQWIRLENEARLEEE